MEKWIYIIRHGETDYNKAGMVQGSGVDSNLNELGRKQALAFYNTYRKEGFEKIYTSALKRTQQSVADFIDDGIPVESIKELNEISWGDFEGQNTSPEMNQRYLGIIQQWRQGQLDVAYSNAETPLEMEKRQKTAIAKIIQNSSEKKILIVTHGRYLRAFLCLLLNKPLQCMDDYQHANLCLYVLKYDGTKYELVREDNRDHLVDLT